MNNHCLPRLLRAERRKIIVARPLCNLVILGASAGGVGALRAIASGLPAGFPAAVVVALHMPRHGESHLPQILGRAGPLPAQFAEDGALPQAGRITVVPPGQQLSMKAGQMQLRSYDDADRFCPAIDVLMCSAADAHGDRVAAAVLSGYLNDGTAGLAHVQAAGGRTIVQEPQEAEADGMPSSALEALRPDYILPLNAIPPVLSWLTGHNRPRTANIGRGERVVDDWVLNDRSA